MWRTSVKRGHASDPNARQVNLKDNIKCVQVEKFSKFFLPKNSQTGIRLREVVWEPTPHLLELSKKAHLLYSTNKKRKRSILTKLTYWKIGPTQELPNQLVLQTGHRNAGAKTAPWTPNATKCCKWTCCSDLPIWQALYQPGMVLLPRWTTVCQMDPPKQPPTRIYKTAAKEI